MKADLHAFAFGLLLPVAPFAMTGAPLCALLLLGLAVLCMGVAEVWR